MKFIVYSLLCITITGILYSIDTEVYLGSLNASYGDPKTSDQEKKQIKQMAIAGFFSLTAERQADKGLRAKLKKIFPDNVAFEEAKKTIGAAKPAVDLSKVSDKLAQTLADLQKETTKGAKKDTLIMQAIDIIADVAAPTFASAKSSLEKTELVGKAWKDFQTKVTTALA